MARVITCGFIACKHNEKGKCGYDGDISLKYTDNEDAVEKVDETLSNLTAIDSEELLEGVFLEGVVCSAFDMMLFMDGDLRDRELSNKVVAEDYEKRHRGGDLTLERISGEEASRRMDKGLTVVVHDRAGYEYILKRTLDGEETKVMRKGQNGMYETVCGLTFRNMHLYTFCKIVERN